MIRGKTYFFRFFRTLAGALLLSFAISASVENRALAQSPTPSETPAFTPGTLLNRQPIKTRNIGRYRDNQALTGGRRMPNACPSGMFQTNFGCFRIGGPRLPLTCPSGTTLSSAGCT